jgi:uncharacterized membrane protein
MWIVNFFPDESTRFCFIIIIIIFLFAFWMLPAIPNNFDEYWTVLSAGAHTDYYGYILVTLVFVPLSHLMRPPHLYTWS